MDVNRLIFLFPHFSLLNPLISHPCSLLQGLQCPSHHSMLILPDCWTAFNTLTYFPSQNVHPLAIKYQDSLMLCSKLCSHSILSLVSLSFPNSVNHYLCANDSQSGVSSPSFSTPDLAYFTSPLGCLKSFSNSTWSRLNLLSSCSKLVLFHCSRSVTGTTTQLHKQEPVYYPQPVTFHLPYSIQHNSADLNS